MKVDPYLIDTLMRDLVAHSRSPAAFLVYLQLYRQTHGAGRESVAISHTVLAGLIGFPSVRCRSRWRTWPAVA